MTPDLTTTQTIGLASAIIGFCLTVFFTTLIVLTYGHQIRRYLRRRGLLVQPRPQTPAHLPFHYVLPFQQPEPARGRLADLAPRERDPETPGTAQRRPTTYVASSSDELLQNREEPGPRNATPGPSNVPAPTANDRDILTRYSWVHEHPPPYDEPHPPQRPVVPHRPRPWMEHPRPIPVFIDQLFQGLPFIDLSSSDSASSSDDAIEPLPLLPNDDDPLPFANEGEHSEPRVRVRRESDPLNPPFARLRLAPTSPRSTGRYSALSGSERGSSDSETSTEDWKDATDIPTPDNPWTDTSPYTEATPWLGPTSRPRSPLAYLQTGTAPFFGPAFGGSRLNNLRPRTPLGQRLLENHLRALSIRLRDRLLREGSREEADAVYVR